MIAGGKHLSKAERVPAGRQSRGKQNRQGFSILSFRKSEQGQELVEFALVLPLLLLILFGAVDLGRVFHAQITIANAARVGARFGMNWNWTKPGGYTAIIDKARAEAANSGITPTDIEVIPDCGSCASRDELTVIVRYPFQLVFGGIVGLPNITLESGAVMTIP